jgi:hypothetical protein
MNRDDVDDQAYDTFDESEQPQEKEPGELDPILQALQVEQLKRGMENAAAFLSWGWTAAVDQGAIVAGKVKEGSAVAYESLKENETVQNVSKNASSALESIKESDNFKRAQDGFEKAKEGLVTSFEHTKPMLISTVEKVRVAVIGDAPPRPRADDDGAAPAS